MPKHKQKSGGSSQSGEPHAKKARIKSSRSEDEDVEEELLNDTQNPDFTAPFDNREAEYGIIEKVSVKNFICHGRLDVNFGPNVNFVVGRNGSGKSAILTAIVVGLGGKASVTNRGSSVKDFIKTGKSVAEICIKMRNRGDDAYKPSEYGTSIIVERKLRKEGGTAYKLKAANGKVISTKREELSHILDHFNIQIDNPVSIMNQDTSKTFLFSKSSKDKYKFFLKATQLEQVSNDYKEISEQRRVTADSIDAQSRKLPELEREVLDLEQKFKDLTCLQKLKENRQDLIHQAAWAQVTELEKTRDSARSAVTKEEARVPKFDEKVELHQVKVREAEEKHSRIQGEVEALRQRLEDLSPQHNIANNTTKKLKMTAKALEKDLRNLSSQIRSQESDRDDIMQRIQDERARDKAQHEQHRLGREQKIAELVEGKADLEAQRQNTLREMDQFSNAVNRAKEQIYGLKSRESEITQVITAGKNRLRNLEGSKKDGLKLYGEKIPALLNEIKKSLQRKEFHQQPLGPIGMYLKLKDERWALGVEVCLKSTLYSFCCHDHHDAQILRRIMARTIPSNGRQPSVITAKFERDFYDIQQNAVQSDFPSFLDIVDISNPVIFNTLIDQRGVESILMIEDSRDARGYLRSGRARNCREGFTLEGDQIYAGAEQRFYSAFQKKAKILKGEIDNEIRETKNEVSMCERDLEELREETQRLKQEVTNNETQRKRAQRQKSRLEDNIGRIRNEVAELEAEGAGEEETNVADLEEEVRQMEAQIHKDRSSQETKSQGYQEARRQLKEAQEQFKEVDDQIQDISYRVDPLKDDLAQASVEVQTAKQHRRHYEEKKRDLLKGIADLVKQADDKDKGVQEAISKARQIYPERLKVSRKAHNLDSEIKQLTKRIRKEQDKQGDPEAITQKYQDARDNYEKINKQMQNMKKFLDGMNKILDRRCLAFNSMRQYIAQRTKYYFITMMSTRGYNGQLKFDHKNSDLILTVDPGQAKKAGDGSKDVRSLSGGERSFSTVCLIMALWESVESPFRAMDEFDVFMDMMNRKIVMELMLQFARDQAIRQFIFLTPQDMSKIRPSPFLRIHRLHDPERNQGVLPMSVDPTQDDEWETENQE